MLKVVFCLPGRNFTNRFLASWTNLLLTCPTLGVTPIVNFAYSNIIYRVRDLCLGGIIGGPADQQPFQGKYKYDYVMWIDSDMVFRPENFKNLLDQMENNRNIKILSTVYPLEDGRLAFRQSTQPSKVEFAGMGFMLVKAGVFEKHSYPWFLPRIQDNSNGAPELWGDDASFCARIKKELKLDIYIDPSVKVGHEKPTVLK